jgi:lysophospholipase L1-like esterase
MRSLARLLSSILLLLVFAVACGGGSSEDPEMAIIQDTASYLALGDSYTIGESVDPADRWPIQLAETMGERGVPLRAPVIIARTGWTTDELAEALDEAAPEGPFDLVSLLIGVNNQYRGRSLQEYRAQLRDLLDRAVVLAGGEPGRVLVLSIPDWGVTPFAEGRDREVIGEEIDAFNRVAREEGLRAGTRFVDVTPISREAASDPGLVAEDGLHPSGAMYARWVEMTWPVATEALRGPEAGSSPEGGGGDDR